MSPGRLGYVIVSGHIRKVSSLPLQNLLAWLNWHILYRQWTPTETRAVIEAIERETNQAMDEHTQLDEAEAAR